MGNKRTFFYIFLTCLTLIIGTLYQPSNTSACDCHIPDTATEAMESVSDVFKGRVLKLSEKTINGEKYDVVSITVSESWKGTKDSEVLVYTDWSSCMFEFEVGKEYLLYAYKFNGKLKVINCGRSSEVTNAQEDLLELGPGRAPTNNVQVQLENDDENKNLGMILGGVLVIGMFSGLIFLRRKKG